MAAAGEKRKADAAAGDAAAPVVVTATKKAALESLFGRPAQAAGSAAPKPATGEELEKLFAEAAGRKRRKVAAHDRAMVVFMTKHGQPERTQEEEAAMEETTVFVDNLPNDVDRKELRQLFKSCCAPGEASKVTARVRSVKFDHKKDSKGLFKGKKLNVLRNKIAADGTASGYVYLPSEAAYQKALLKDGEEFVGRHIRVAPARGGAEPFDSSTSLFLGNLLLELQEEQLRAFCEEKGVSATKVRLIRDPKTRKGKGFGFVSFASPEEAARALRVLRGQYLEGREVRAKRCMQRDAERDQRLREHRAQGESVTFSEMQKLKRSQFGGKPARGSLVAAAQKAKAWEQQWGKKSEPKRRKKEKPEPVRENVWEGSRAPNTLTREVAKLTKQWSKTTGAAQSAASKVKKTVEKQRRDERKIKKKQAKKKP